MSNGTVQCIQQLVFVIQFPIFFCLCRDKICDLFQEIQIKLFILQDALLLLPAASHQSDNSNDFYSHPYRHRNLNLFLTVIAMWTVLANHFFSRFINDLSSAGFQHLTIYISLC